MIGARGQSVQLRLDLVESPAPAAALWELLGEEQRRAAMVPITTTCSRANPNSTARSTSAY
jgi:hypothetical protein